jgi:hypothetical protein
MASVKLRKPAPVSAIRSMIISTSRRDRESRVQLPDHQHVTFAELIQKSMKFRPVPAPSRCLFAENALALCFLQRSNLGDRILVVS